MLLTVFILPLATLTLMLVQYGCTPKNKLITTSKSDYRNIHVDKLSASPARVVQWLDHLGAMCSTALRAQCVAGPEFNQSRGPVRRVRLHKSNYVKKIPMHMMITEIIPGRQQRVRSCPL